jgi:hypothetical protein
MQPLLVFTPNPTATRAGIAPHEKFFNGYHLYIISGAECRYDLPLYPRLKPVSRHDSVSLVVSSAVEFKQRLTLGTVEKMLLDAAHDSEVI